MFAIAQTSRMLSSRGLVTITRSVASSTDATRTERPRRCLFSVPGADEKKIAKAKTLGADSVVLDLEDGVAYDKKEQARNLVQQALLGDKDAFGRAELCVRINCLDTKALAIKDLEAILPCDNLQAIVVPKVETLSDVTFVDKLIDASGNDVCILAAVESALGMLNLREIAATASATRLEALIFASEDYCANLEAIRTTEATELLFARSQLVVTAKAYGLQAIDMVHINFRNVEQLETECRQGRELGFTGKQAIHPSQVEPIHNAFCPAPKDIDFSQRAVEAYETASQSGQGACVVDGIVVDMPVYKWATKILHRANAMGLL